MPSVEGVCEGILFVMDKSTCSKSRSVVTDP